MTDTQTMPLPTVSQTKLPALIPRKKKVTTESSLPVPEAPPLPSCPDLSSLRPQIPIRRILSEHDHKLFLSSLTHSLLLSFVFALSDSCQGKKYSDVQEAEPIIQSILSILQAVSEKIEANPPIDQGASRFGNPAFRSFIDAVTSRSEDLHKQIPFPSTTTTFIKEVMVYFENSLGSRSRIDYGSGHELNFLTWLLCLNRLSLLPQETFPAVSLIVIPKYIHLMRKIQSTYYLEPAGSHGVWGLDDYQFIPFLLGASQLTGHPYITPRAVHNEAILDEEADNFIYLDMVRYTVQSKSVKGLKWTQPMLDDISSAKSWAKVEQGMRRMFDKEVLDKLPVMQHFLFGSLVPAETGMSGAANGNNGEAVEGGVMANEPHPHVHQLGENEWGDCCGIKLPSMAAAAEEDRKHGQQPLRRIPFD